ncbi:MAG TPA: BBP7 family outer membrane beta-barrel protein [Bradyrhizobium sp.]|nr:BBP7 family outer membrane beta-barrel protein [Bradyrhizobium sp.]
MKKIGGLLAISAGAVALASSANAASSKCLSIADPMTRLACYDKAAGAPSSKAPLGKTSDVPRLEGLAADTMPTKPIVKALSPAKPAPRFWLEAEGGIYGFSKNLPVIAATAPPASTGPTFVPTAPGFIGLVSTSTVTNPLATGGPADGGGGGSYRMGYWLDPERTMAVEGSVFYVRGNSAFNLSGAPTTVKTSTFVNTTPDVFVGLFDDTTTTTLSNAGISDQLYGADANFRMKAPRVASLSNFDVMVGVRYVALDEKLTASVTSLFTRTFQPGLGLPPPVDFSNSLSGSGAFRIRNDFIGPQVGFNAEQHWGRYWVASENKLAVGAVIEGLSVSGSSVSSTTPTTTLSLAGIPLAVNGGAPVTGTVGGPNPFGLFAQGDRSKTTFAIVPSGNIKVGYDVIPDMLSLTLAYNYLYMSNVGRVGDQITSPLDIRQSSFFAQGITFGAKALF